MACRLRRPLAGVLFAALTFGAIAPLGAAQKGILAARGRRAVPVPRTTILGHAWTADNQPLPGVEVQLRNVLNGGTEARTITDQNGQFSYLDVDGGTYAIEIVEGSKIRAVSQVFTISPGETVATFVRLGTRQPWFAGVFGNSAAAVISNAAALGISAVAPVGLDATCCTPP